MPNWTGVITNAGSLLLSEWVNEKTLTITSAQAGTGTVPTVALMGQTALVNPKQTAAIAGGGEIEGGKRVNLQVTAAETEYTLNQFGLYAKVDGGSPVLLAIYQNEEGVPIPALSDTPDFLYTFMAAIAVSNQGTWEVTISAYASLTWDHVGVPNGIAGLDAIGKLPASQLPSIAASSVTYDNDTSEMTATNVQAALDELQVSVENAAAKALYTTITLPQSGWSSLSQTVTVPGIDASENSQFITVGPMLSSQQEYYTAEVMVTAQAENSLTFTCAQTPASDLTVYVVVMGVTTAS